jgi:hypothetical protein
VEVVTYTYRLTLDALTDVRATFTTDFEQFPTGNLVVRWEMGRDDWIYQGRPTTVDVTVSVP